MSKESHMQKAQGLTKLTHTLQKWEETILSNAKRKNNERREEFSTSSTITKELYTPLDTEDLDYIKDIGFPGEYPFTRGIQPNMYRGRLWTMRQYAGFGTPEETNSKFRYLLEQGQTGLSVAFDLPTQLGHDSDDPRAIGEVGKVGVAIDSLKDMEAMFYEIPLEKVSTSMTINSPAAIMLAMYIAVGEKQGVNSSQLNGTVQNDVLKEYVARGTYIYPPKASLRLSADLIGYCSSHVPKWNSISISGYHIRDAGSTAAQEIAFTFANAIAYIEAVCSQGIDIDDFAPRISWIFNTHNNFLEEIAKYRALRRLWAKIVKERFKAKNPRSCMLRTHIQTGGSTLTAQQPENNIVRAAIQSLASILGGVQSMALSCYDEALAIPTDDAQRIALRTQQVLAYETGVTDTVDPLAGSYYVEHLTNQLEEKASDIMDKIEDMGGAVTAIEDSWMQREITSAAYKYQQEIEDGTRVIVGVNQFTDGPKQSPGIFKVDPSVAKIQTNKIAQLKSERNQKEVANSLNHLREEALGEKNLFPPILASVKSYATTGEICDTLREAFGEYQPHTEV